MAAKIDASEIAAGIREIKGEQTGENKSSKGKSDAKDFLPSSEEMGIRGCK